MRWQVNVLTTRADAPPASWAPAGYPFDAQGTQHVIYQGYATGEGGDGTLHELHWNTSGWHHLSLTNAANADLADQFTSLAGYVLPPPSNTQHVYYRLPQPFAEPPVGSPISMLAWDGNWNYYRLSQDVGAPGTLSGPAASPFGYEHAVLYRGVDDHLEAITFPLGQWVDVTAAAGAELVQLEVSSYGAPPSPSESSSTPHAVYVGVDGSLNHAWRDSGGSWHHENLTLVVGPMASASGTPVAFVDSQGRHLVFYVSSDSLLHLLSRDLTGNWTHQLISPPGAPVAGSVVAAYDFAAQGTLHVLYQGQDGRLYHLWWNDHSGWAEVEDLSAIGIGAKQIPAPDAACGYVFSVPVPSQHIVYTSTSHDIVELYWTPLASNPQYVVPVSGDYSPGNSLSPFAPDIVAFGDEGVWVALGDSDGAFSDPQLAIPNFGYSDSAGGWRVAKHPRLVADITGDGRGDVVGFGDFGVWVSLSQGGGAFSQASLVLENFGYEAGSWRVDRHPRFLAELRTDFGADIVGFGDAGVWTALSNGEPGQIGNGTFHTPLLVLPGYFGYLDSVGGWRVDRHLRLLADLTGDGRADIVGFGDAGVWTALGNGDGTFQTPQLVLQNFGYVAGGWRVDRHLRLLADLTGDGRADIVGFGDAGVWTALGNGDGTFQTPQLVLLDFGYVAGGWRVDRHPRLLADIDGDQRADIVGFGDAGIYAALSNGDGTFRRPNPWLGLADFGYVAGGWRVDRNPRFLADVTGDYRADVVGFGNLGIRVAHSLGDGHFSASWLAAADFGYEPQSW